jgi:hypothetical protein
MPDAPAGRESRRAFMLRVARTAGVAPLAMALLEGRGEAAPRGEDSDREILYAALTLEHHAIALYDFGLRESLFPTDLRRYAVEFRGDHLGHRDTQAAIARERGGDPPEALRAYSFDPTPGGNAFLRDALEIELAAQRAYSALISGIATPDYLLSAAFILIDEVRHITVWRRVLGLKIY